jgi:hypothetical protein
MSTMKRVLLSLSLFCLAVLLASASSGKPVPKPAAASSGRELMAQSLSLHLALAGLVKPEAPRVVDGFLVLSVAGPYRFVGAAFDHEGFASIHPFERNRQGVYVLAYPVPLKRGEALVYRLVIDGVWTIDPSNPRRVRDPAGGHELSVAEVPYLSDLHLGLYKILGSDGRTAHFLYRGEPGLVVTLAGDFNGWDPFLYEMAETSPGRYELELALGEGLRFYAFICRGEYIADPLNPDKAVRSGGIVVSMLAVGKGADPSKVLVPPPKARPVAAAHKGAAE